LTYSLRHASWLESRVRCENGLPKELAPFDPGSKPWTVYSYILRTSIFSFQRVEARVGTLVLRRENPREGEPGDQQWS
jgi:hypothetical protein